MTNKPTLGRDFDRDKNLTYRPQDESGDLPSFSYALTENTRQESIVDIILEQHRLLKDYVKILKSSTSDTSDKQKALFDLVVLWTAHTQAEENTLYDEIVFSKEVQKQIDNFFEEHVVTQVLIEDLEALNFRLSWHGDIETKAKALAEVVHHHLTAEEESFLKLVKNLLLDEDLTYLGREFTRQFEIFTSHYKASLRPSRMLL